MIALKDYVDELSERMAGALANKDYHGAVQSLQPLLKLDVIGHAFVTRLVFEAKQTVERTLSRLERESKEAAAYGNFEGADTCITELGYIDDHFACIEGMPDIRAVVQTCTTFLHFRREEKQKMDEMQEAVKKMTDAKQKLEGQLTLIAEQQAAQKEELERLEKERNKIIEQSAQEQKRLEQVGQPFPSCFAPTNDSLPGLR